MTVRNAQVQGLPPFPIPPNKVDEFKVAGRKMERLRLIRKEIIYIYKGVGFQIYILDEWI